MSEYTMKIDSANNTLTVDVTAHFDFFEDFDGNEQCNILLKSAQIVHGNRRREVLPLLTEEQQDFICKEIIRQENQNFQEYF